MRLFVRGVLIGLVTAAPNGFHLDIKKFARYLVASVEEVGETLHDLEAEGILQYEQDYFYLDFQLHGGEHRTQGRLSA